MVRLMSCLCSEGGRSLGGWESKAVSALMTLSRGRGILGAVPEMEAQLPSLLEEGRHSMMAPLLLGGHGMSGHFLLICFVFIFSVKQYTRSPTKMNTIPTSAQPLTHLCGYSRDSYIS